MAVPRQHCGKEWGDPPVIRNVRVCVRMLEQSLDSLAMALARGDEGGSLAREVLLVHRDGGAGQQDAQDVNIS